MRFSISVIIPAYNVEGFVEKAILSAVQQPEVIEVLVVNDGSTDGTQKRLEKLRDENLKVIIFQHKNGANLGRSATRNLGIQKARANYIAFLDADDFYLENRFVNDKFVFENIQSCDGVYNAVGFHYYRKATAAELQKSHLNSLSKKLAPQELFDGIVSSKYGYLHLNGITVKRSVFDSIGLLNDSLLVAEDSDIIFKMALKCNLEAGIISQPLALRGIHDSNIFNNEDVYKIYNIKLYESILSWSYKNKIALQQKDTILKWLWFFKFRDGNSLWNHVIYWFFLVKKNPEFFFSILGIKYFPLIRLRQILFPFLFTKQY